MTLRRWAVFVFLAAVLAAPLVQPFVELGSHWPGIGPWTDSGRLLALCWNTLQLVGGVLLIAMPAGIAGAVLLFRTDLPFRRVLQFATVLFLFIPLPLLASAWQAALGTGGWLPVVIWENRPNQPWTQGLGPAIWLHALAAIPWVILLVGQGLCWVEGELEEDALLHVHPLRVLWTVTLPRCRATILAAAIWIALQTAGEITVVYMMQVTTFAEQVHTQFTQGANPLAETLVLMLPAVLLAWLLVVLLVPRLEKKMPPLGSMLRAPRRFEMGPVRWLISLGAFVIIAFLAVVPVASLVWKAGLRAVAEGEPRTFSPRHAWAQFSRTFVLDGDIVGASILWAASAGLTCAGLALVCSWLARESRWLRVALMLLVALAAVLPGPVVGLGLKGVIDLLISWFPGTIVEQSLYGGPSALPAVWVQVIRFFPYALLLVWPVVRLIPREYFDFVRVEGGRPTQEFTQVVWPLARKPALWGAVLVTALCLTEIAATVRVETPGTATFAKLVFDRMHYGVENDLASLCLVLLAWILLAVPVIGLVYWLNRPARNTLPAVDRSLPGSER